MEKSSVQETLVTEVKDGVLRPPEQRSVRRRLIQSTLFPHRSQDNAKVVEEKQNDDDCGEGEDDDQEYCGSQSKKKKKRKGKTMPLPRASKKGAVNGKESPNKEVDDKDSPIAVKMRSPRQLKEKRKVNTTPIKTAMPNGLKGSCSPNAMSNEHTSQPMPNLRLEAKMIAEENSRMFEGRQIHPFFSSRKSSKRYQETIEVESKSCLVERQHTSITLGPIHVFETVQDDAMSLNWRNWEFCERTFINSSFGLESTLSSLFQGSVESLHFDNILGVSDPLIASLPQNELSLEQCCFQQECLHAPKSSAVLADEQVVCYQLLNDKEVEHEADKVGFISGHSGHLKNSDDVQQSSFLQERIMSYYLDCCNLPKDRLWTKKYQPEKAIEVCGNGESVKFLSEWLHLWHERDFRISKDSTDGDKCIVQDIDYSFYESDSDSENIGEETKLKNVLLITGPVGSGKSAAIYACAKEQGFEVIEVNTSDWRNGALVKQQFKEAVESHRLKWSHKNHVGSQSKHIMNSSPAQPNGEAAQGLDNEVIELIPLSDEEDPHDAIRESGKFVCKESRTAYDRGEIKSLVLFDDVDITFVEDRGFIAAIQEIAGKAKLPMILTTNSNGHVLPDNMDRLEMSFTVPSPEELLHHVYMVCDAEKANIQPQLIEQFAEYCHGDIRKTITHLQFWCQGKRNRKDGKGQKIYGPMLFDLEAVYQMLPKIIPWDFPSQLSELVEKEIARSLSIKEEKSSIIEVVEEEELDNEARQNGLGIHNNETSTLEAKKEALLSRNCALHDCIEFESQIDAACEFSNSSGSPVAFTRRSVRRKLDTVLSSCSGDEFCGDGFPVVLVEETNSEEFLEVDSEFLPLSPELQHCLEPLTEQLLHFEVGSLKENHYQCSDTAANLPIDNMCRSVDISWVPESSFVPETEINCGTELLSRTVSCGRVAGIVEAVSMHNELIQNLSSPIEVDNHDKSGTELLSRTVSCGHVAGIVEAVSIHNDASPIEVDNLNKSLPRLCRSPEIMKNTCDVNGESIHGEEVGDSQNQHMEAVMREYQVMDECSRMDFNRKMNPAEKPRSWVLTDLVQETWRNLRACHTDLRQYVTSEQKDTSQILKLAFGISNLISETDLLSNCQLLVSDSLGPSMVPDEETDSLSWYNEQLQMTSSIAQHGFCFYANDIAALGSNMGSESRVDFAREMLASTTNTIALGKLSIKDVRSSWRPNTGENLEMRPPKSAFSLKRELESSLHGIVQSIVPSRSYLAVKGDAFYEYLSSLGHISRSETSRLLENTDQTKRRRRRVARHYLSTNTLMLSPEDILLLNQYNCYGKFSFQSTDASLR